MKRGFARRCGFDLECVYTPVYKRSQRLVDTPVALDQRHMGKCG